MKSLYLLLHLFTIFFPLVSSFEHKINYYRKWSALFPGILITATLFISWDVIFTHMGVWGFNTQYTLGINILHLPIEEWLFFFTIPFACVFIYEAVGFYFPRLSTSRLLRLMTLVAASFVLGISIANQEKAYTFWNLLFCAMLLIYTAYKNPPWLGQFWLSYLFHLIPFFLVNGILTGSFIEDQVVWYNNAENLGMRIGTIPVEDALYSLLLLLLNIFLFEWFKKRGLTRTSTTIYTNK